MIRYHLTLSSRSNSSDWYCSLHWSDGDGYVASVAERGRGEQRTMRFATASAARSGGVRLANKLAAGRAYLVTEGSVTDADPQQVVAGPAVAGRVLNARWRAYERLGGRHALESKRTEVKKLYKAWTAVMSRTLGESRRDQRRGLLGLAQEYRRACAAMAGLWLALVTTSVESDERNEAIREFNAGGARTRAARSALLLRAGGGISETGET